ncbi:hypothetical protein ACQJBY_049890 [Aegilops geniculata]
MAAVSTAQTLPFLTVPTFQSSPLFLPTARRAPTSLTYAGRPAPAVASCPRPGGTHRTQAAQLVLPVCTAASYSAASAAEGMSDPELRLVLELATDEELLELEEILYGTSYFSPVLKSIAKRPNTVSVVALDDIEERDLFISKLESRFLYLAADARSVLRGWRPSYRNVLLQVRRELGVQCSSKLCSADLEAEIFLHLLDEYSSRQKGSFSFPWDKQKSPKENPSIEVNNWKVLTDAAWRIGAKGLESTFLKGGSALTVKTIYESPRDYLESC